MFRSVIRVIRFALQNFFRNIWLSIATLTVIVITLLLVNVLISINYIKNSSLAALEKQIDLSLDFKSTIPESTVRSIRSELLQDERVGSITIITPEENLSALSAKYNFLEDSVLPALERNPLGYTLRITARELSNYSGLLETLETRSDLDDLLIHRNLNDHRLFISWATVVTDRINMGVLIAAGIFLVISLIIIFNTIKVSVYTHRDEISIMKLVGASNWFIRMPYVFESFMYATLATGITASIVYGIIYITEPLLDAFFGSVLSIDLASYFSANAITIFGIQGITTLLVITGSVVIGSRRFLRI